MPEPIVPRLLVIPLSKPPIVPPRSKPPDVAEEPMLAISPIKLSMPAELITGTIAPLESVVYCPD
jgi:hypothetical protein